MNHGLNERCVGDVLKLSDILSLGLPNVSRKPGVKSTANRYTNELQNRELSNSTDIIMRVQSLVMCFR